MFYKSFDKVKYDLNCIFVSALNCFQKVIKSSLIEYIYILSIHNLFINKHEMNFGWEFKVKSAPLVFWIIFREVFNKFEIVKQNSLCNKIFVKGIKFQLLNFVKLASKFLKRVIWKLLKRVKLFFEFYLKTFKVI